MEAHDIIIMLRTAHRIGATTDRPEGARWIMVSDTLANEIADVLERTTEDLLFATEQTIGLPGM